MTSGKTTGLILLGLYLATWLPAVVMIRHGRRVYSPTVYPILPAVVLSCDRKPSVAGEWSVYLTYGIGVRKLFPIQTWIE